MPTTAPPPAPPADGGDAVQASRLWFHRGAAPAMPRMHRHDDLEVNLVVAGRLEYLRGGERLVVGAGRAALFWGATPHRLVPGAADGAAGATDACWLHVPVATVLRWRLPEADLARLLSGEAVVLPHACTGPGPVDRFETWVRELADPEAAPGAMLEVEALVRRLLLHARRSGSAGGPDPGADEGPEALAPVAERGKDPVADLARFCVERFREPVSTADAAAAVGLSAPYATTLFRRRMGMTLGAYLTGCRVAEARRLLLTTSASAADVASAAGFGSQSSFYDHFTRATGSTPATYRRAAG